MSIVDFFEVVGAYKEAFKEWQDANEALFSAKASIPQLEKAVKKAEYNREIAAGRLLTQAVIRGLE